MFHIEILTGGAEPTLDEVVSPYNSARSKLQLGLAPSNRIYLRQAVVVSYEKPNSGAALDGTSGDRVASFATGESGVPSVTNNSTERISTAGTVELSVSATTVAEGNVARSGDTTVTTDVGPPNGLSFMTGLLTEFGSAASPDDYNVLLEQVCFLESDGWTRTGIGAGTGRYVLN